MKHGIRFLMISVLAFFSLSFVISFEYSDAVYNTRTAEDGTIIVLKQYFPSNSWIPYDSENLVSWDDFEEKDPSDKPHSAVISTLIRYEYAIQLLNESNCKFSFLENVANTTAYFNKDRSWVRPNGKTDATLNHEHGHFHVAQIYAKKLKLELTYLEPKIFSCSGETDKLKKQSMIKNSQIIIQEITDEIFHMKNFTNKNYDYDVRNGPYPYHIQNFADRNFSYEISTSDSDFPQKRWDHIFDSMLADPTLSLAEAESIPWEYSSSEVVCHDFTKLIIADFFQYLIGGMIIAPPTSSDGEGTIKFPSWIENNACWWFYDLIPDDDFVLGLEYLIKNGILYVP